MVFEIERISADCGVEELAELRDHPRASHRPAPGIRKFAR
jgi:hypothetical protein